MITDTILTWILGLGDWLVGLMPDGPNIDFGGIAQGWSMLADLNFFLPIAELTSAVLVVLALGPAFVVATLLQWFLVSVLRGGSAKA